MKVWQTKKEIIFLTNVLENGKVSKKNCWCEKPHRSGVDKQSSQGPPPLTNPTADYEKEIINVFWNRKIITMTTIKKKLYALHVKQIMKVPTHYTE